MTKSRRPTPKPQRSRVPVALILAGAAVLLFALVLALLNRSAPAAPASPEVTGSPRLSVDQERVDLGDVRMGIPVQVSVKLTNTGDQTLRFTEAPYIEVLEGC